MPEDRPFVDAAHRPDATEVSDVLGPAGAAVDRIVSLTAGFGHEWIYSKGSGWMLKVSDGKKALCYLIPLQAAVRVSLTVREGERDSLRHFG